MPPGLPGPRGSGVNARQRRKERRAWDRALRGVDFSPEFYAAWRARLLNEETARAAVLDGYLQAQRPETVAIKTEDGEILWRRAA